MLVKYDPETSGKNYVVIEGKPIISGLCAIDLAHARKVRDELIKAIDAAEEDMRLYYATELAKLELKLT